MTLRAKSPKHQGQAMVEFLIVMPVFILLIFVTVQVALIYSAKTTLNYATFQAARIGALNNATYTGIRKGLIRGLAPLFTNSNSRTGPDVSQDIAAGIDSGGSRKDAASEVDGYVRIIRVSPRAAIFSTGSSGFGELNSDGIAQIPNSQLMYRDSRLASNVNIQDANLLKIRVQYCYELIVPMVSRMIGSLVRVPPRHIISMKTGSSQDFLILTEVMPMKPPRLPEVWPITVTCVAAEVVWKTEPKTATGLLLALRPLYVCSLQLMKMILILFLVATCAVAIV